jgi:dienelactone hydrolase
MAVLLPSAHQPGMRRLPVLMDPYGGPGAQRVLAARGCYLVSQWFADQGFAVVIADGRGTPGRGPAWERTIYGDRGELALEDQVTALHAAAERYPDLDLDRVGIRGWSFGGYLAALAVLRRPDVFHAAAAGAPVTDQRLYNTHWNERYLGHPDDDPGAYDRSSLLADAVKLRRPLMLLHGLADDNVAAAHTLLLSSALTAAGRPHTVLLLPQPLVAAADRRRQQCPLCEPLPVRAVCVQGVRAEVRPVGRRQRPGTAAEFGPLLEQAYRLTLFRSGDCRRQAGDARSDHGDLHVALLLSDFWAEVPDIAIVGDHLRDTPSGRGAAGMTGAGIRYDRVLMLTVVAG